MTPSIVESDGGRVFEERVGDLAGRVDRGTNLRSSAGINGGLFVAMMLMILFRVRYPRWWFDFAGN